MIQIQKSVSWLIFVVYMLVLVKVILFKTHISYQVMDFNFRLKYGSNFIPFKTILEYILHSPSTKIGIRNVLGNIVLFIPLGIFLPVLSRNSSIISVIFFGFLVSFLFEITQFITGWGSFDIDDIFLNTLGAFAGGIFIKLLKRYGSRHLLVSH